MSPNDSVGVDEILFRCTRIKISVCFHSIVEGNNLRVDTFGNVNLVAKNGIQQRAIVAFHRALASNEAQTLGPSKSDSQGQSSHFGC